MRNKGEHQFNTHNMVGRTGHPNLFRGRFGEDIS